MPESSWHKDYTRLKKRVDQLEKKLKDVYDFLDQQNRDGSDAYDWISFIRRREG
jgi:hypothetical protein